MCGIAGFISPDLTEEHLRTAARVLQHRGPDAEGFYYSSEDNVGLGHRHLSILIFRLLETSLFILPMAGI